MPTKIRNRKTNLVLTGDWVGKDRFLIDGASNPLPTIEDEWEKYNEWWSETGYYIDQNDDGFIYSVDAIGIQYVHWDSWKDIEVRDLPTWNVRKIGEIHAPPLDT